MYTRSFANAQDDNASSFFIQIRLNILVSPSRHGEHYDVFGLETELLQRSQGMCRFECRDDAFQSSQLEGGTDSFIIVDGIDRGTVPGGKIGVEWSDARIVQSGGDGIRL